MKAQFIHYAKDEAEKELSWVFKADEYNFDEAVNKRKQIMESL